MVKKIGKISHFGKALGVVGNLLAIPDALNAVKHVTDKAAPIIEKELDRRHNHKQSLITLDNLIDVPLQDAKTVLHDRGFIVLPILSKPNPKYSQERPMDIVAIQPRPGKYEVGQLVKLYYVDEVVIKDSQEMKKSHEENQIEAPNKFPHIKKFKFPFQAKK